MTPRTGLLVALVGLVIAVLCAIPLYFIGNLYPTQDDAVMGIIVLYLCALLSLIVFVVGLVIAVATALRGKHHHPL
jgi:energy-converting hydrogenase Eha subunit B